MSIKKEMVCDICGKTFDEDDIANELSKRRISLEYPDIHDVCKACSDEIWVSLKKLGIEE